MAKSLLMLLKREDELIKELRFNKESYEEVNGFSNNLASHYENNTKDIRCELQKCRKELVEYLELLKEWWNDMAKEFNYTKTKELGKLSESTTVEVGHYTVDGKEMPDKIYLVNHFTRKNGSEDSKATAICKLEEAKQLGEILVAL